MNRLDYVVDCGGQEDNVVSAEKVGYRGATNLDPLTVLVKGGRDIGGEKCKQHCREGAALSYSGGDRHWGCYAAVPSYGALSVAVEALEETHELGGDPYLVQCSPQSSPVD